MLSRSRIWNLRQKKMIFTKKNRLNRNQLKSKKTMKSIFMKWKESLQKKLFASKKKEDVKLIQNLKWNESNETIIITNEWNEMSWLIAKNYWSNLKSLKKFNLKKFTSVDQVWCHLRRIILFDHSYKKIILYVQLWFHTISIIFTKSFRFVDFFI